MTDFLLRQLPPNKPMLPTKPAVSRRDGERSMVRPCQAEDAWSAGFAVDRQGVGQMNKQMPDTQE